MGLHLYARSEGILQNKINSFMRTPWYIVCLAVITAVSSLLGLDLYMYTAFIALGIYMSLFGRDYLPLVPIVMFCYIGPSLQNNPGRYPGSVFYPMNGGIYLVVLAASFVVSVVFRLVRDKELGGMGFLKTKRKLLRGMILLGLAYLLGGICMDQYRTVALRNLVFALLQFAAIALMYFFFTGAVKWKQVPREYLAWVGMCIGFVVLTQLLENYLSGRIFVGSTIDRERIATGWGMHNNVGGLIAMTMPFAFYLANHYRRGWIFAALGTVLMLGTLASCSRGSMLTAGAAYLVCAILLIRNPQTRRWSLIVYGAAALIVALGAVVLWDKLMAIFDKFISEMGNVSQRDNLLYYGWKRFLEEPIFGSSFYIPEGSPYTPWDWADLEAFSSFFPPRWHNTLIQIASSSGVVGLVAYAVHRVQTVKLLLKNRSRENTYIALFLAILLAASLLDCHFFNIGPVLLYSMALAFAEKFQAE